MYNRMNLKEYQMLYPEHLTKIEDALSQIVVENDIGTLIKNNLKLGIEGNNIKLLYNDELINSIEIANINSGSETTAYYDGIIDFGDNIAYFPLSSFTENSTILMTLEEWDGKAGNIFTSNSILSTAAEYPTTAAIRDDSNDVIYFYNNFGTTCKYTSLWSSNWEYPLTELISQNGTTRTTPSTTENNSSWNNWTEDASNVQSFNGFIALNMSSNKTVTNELTNYNTITSLSSLKSSGAISTCYSTLKLSCFKVWSNQTFSSISEAKSTAITPDIWLRIDSNGKPVNAGTSGNIVYTGFKSATVSEN